MPISFGVAARRHNTISIGLPARKGVDMAGVMSCCEDRRFARFTQIALGMEMVGEVWYARVRKGLQ